MRSLAALLCFSFLFSATWAADPGPSPTDTYILARDRYIAAFRHISDRGRNAKRAGEAFAEVKRLLQAAVPSWKAPGFPAVGEVHLNCLDDNQMGFSTLDGLVYRAGDTEVVVTNRGLMKGEVPAVFHNEEFWTFAVGCDAAAFIHDFVSVKAPEGADSVTVAVAGFHNGLDYDATPDELLAAVVRGDRVWIATEKLKPPLAPLTGCVEAYKRGIDEYPWAPTVQESALLHDKAMSRAVKNYLRCFAHDLRSRPAYAAVQNQAQALVDLLH